MSQDIDLNYFSRNIYRTVLEDGLLETMLGVYLILSGIFLMNKTLILNYLFLPFALILIESLRRKFIFPRVGYVKIKIPAKSLVNRFSFILIGFAVTILLTAFLSVGIGQTWFGSWRDFISYALILVAVVFFCGIGIKFKIVRWFLHGILVGIVFLLSKMIDAHGLLILLGVYVAIIGIVVFLRFIQENPIQPVDFKGVPDAS